MNDIIKQLSQSHNIIRDFFSSKRKPDQLAHLFEKFVFIGMYPSDTLCAVNIQFLPQLGEK